MNSFQQLRDDVADYLKMGMPAKYEQAEFYNKMINMAIKKMNRMMKRFCPMCKKQFKNQLDRKEHLLLVHKLKI